KSKMEGSCSAQEAARGVAHYEFKSPQIFPALYPFKRRSVTLRAGRSRGGICPDARTRVPKQTPSIRFRSRRPVVQHLVVLALLCQRSEISCSAVSTWGLNIRRRRASYHAGAGAVFRTGPRPP